MNRRYFLVRAAGAAAGAAAFPQLHAADAPAVKIVQVVKTEDEWRKLLTPAQFSVLRQEGTERPFSSPLNNEKRKGTFVCVGCDLLLFESRTKFDSGTGWPSFTAPFAAGHLASVTDRSYGMERTETLCGRCGSHQGHVFPDGPPPTHQRYCINSVSLDFVAEGQPLPDKLGRGETL